MSFAIFAVARRARRRRRSDFPHSGDIRQQLLHALTTQTRCDSRGAGRRHAGPISSTALHPDEFIWTDFQAIRPVPDVRNHTLLFTSILHFRPSLVLASTLSLPPSSLSFQ
jgi:hypothetical protein